MRLCLILDAVDYPTAPNPRLALRVAEQWVRRGHGVHILFLWDGCTPLPPLPDGCTHTLLSFAAERWMNEALEHGNAAGSPTAERLARLARSPAATLAAVQSVGLHRPPRQAACRRALQQLDAQHHFDAIVAVAAPYYAAFALGQAHLRARRFAWLMDPYSQNRAYQPDKGAFAREEKMYRAMDGLFVPPLMLPDYAPLAPFGAFAAKTRELEFPALARPGRHPSRPPDDRLRCVFVGSLYSTIRTPHALLALFAALPNKNVELVFVGGGWEHFAPGVADACRARMGDRLHILGQLPPEQAARCTAGADVLLSIGNTVENQLPSKLFDYFATGKPVLHLAASARDPALPYLARYPLGCPFLPGDPPEKAAAFLQARPQALPFAQVSRLFFANTPAAVADALLQAMAAKCGPSKEV